MSDELERLRAARMRELAMQQSGGAPEEAARQAQAQAMEEQVKKIVKQLLDVDAQSRLANIRLANPDFARQVEILLIQLYQSGRLAKMGDEQFKALLLKIKSGKRDTKIQVR